MPSALAYNDFVLQKGKGILKRKKGKGIGEKYSECCIQALGTQRKEKGVVLQERHRKLEHHLKLAPRDGRMFSILHSCFEGYNKG